MRYPFPMSSKIVFNYFLRTSKICHLNRYHSLWRGLSFLRGNPPVPDGTTYHSFETRKTLHGLALLLALQGSHILQVSSFHPLMVEITQKRAMFSPLQVIGQGVIDTSQDNFVEI